MNEQPLYGIDPLISTEKIRVLRDHAARAKQELDRIATKLPEIGNLWSTGVEGTAIKLSIAELIQYAAKLEWFLEGQYQKREPKPVKAANIRRRKKVKHSNQLVLYNNRGRHMHFGMQYPLIPKTKPRKALLRVREKENV
jgi:hypothetical protein